MGLTEQENSLEEEKVSQEELFLACQAILAHLAFPQRLPASVVLKLLGSGCLHTLRKLLKMLQFLWVTSVYR